MLDSADARVEISSILHFVNLQCRFINAFEHVLGRYALQGNPVPGFPFVASIVIVFSGTQLFVLSAQPVPLYASVSIRLLNNADSVATARGVQQALANYLWALPPGGPDGGGWPLGRAVAPDELRTQAGRVAG